MRGAVVDERLEAVDDQGRVERLGRVTASATASMALSPACYPNPFNPSTTVRYELRAPGVVTVAVYDVAGLFQ